MRLKHQALNAQPPDLSRRALIGGLLGAMGCAVVPPVMGLGTAPGGSSRWISASSDQQGGYWLSSVSDAAGADSASGLTRVRPLFQIPSRVRGHAVLRHPTRPELIVMMARSPGRVGLVADQSSGQKIAEFESLPGHHMHGHGCFSADGDWFYATESDYRSGEGKLMIRNTRNWAIEGSFSTYGIGPHEVRLMPGGQQLVVANGGLRTHPSSGRQILNFGSMDSSLLYLDALTGERLEQVRIADPKASIRHLDVAQDGTVAFATQRQTAASSTGSHDASATHASKDDNVLPLAGLHRFSGLVDVQGERAAAKGSLRMLKAPERFLQQFRGYMGSVHIHNDQRLVAFSSPKGNLVGFWHLDTGELMGHHRFFDVCGLALDGRQQHFVLSNSRGEIRLIQVSNLKENPALRIKASGVAWDNHMMSVAV